MFKLIHGRNSKSLAQSLVSGQVNRGAGAKAGHKREAQARVILFMNCPTWVIMFFSQKDDHVKLVVLPFLIGQPGLA